MGSPGLRGGPELCKSEFFEYSFGSPSGRNFISKSGRFQACFSFRLDKSDSSDVLKPWVLSDFRKICIWTHNTPPKVGIGGSGD